MERKKKQKVKIWVRLSIPILLVVVLQGAYIAEPQFEPKPLPPEIVEMVRNCQRQT